jgi:hypothetical protein
MMSSGDLTTIFQHAYNRRHPPGHAIRLDERIISTYEIIGYTPMGKKVDLAYIMAFMPYDELWPDTMRKLKEWVINNNVEKDLDNFLYTWSSYDIALDSMRIKLWIHFPDIETRMLFKLSYFD